MYHAVNISEQYQYMHGFLWRDMEKYFQKFSSQIPDRVKTGVAGKLTQEEIDSYKGPMLYLSHHETLKPDSELTLCRVVFN